MLTATVYAQCEPKPVRSSRIGNDTHTEYSAVFEIIGTVKGTKSECWDMAKELHPCPALEFDAPLRIKDE